MKVENFKNKELLEKNINKMKDLLMLYIDLETVNRDKFEKLVIDTGFSVFSVNDTKENIKDLIISNIEEKIHKIERELENL